MKLNPDKLYLPVIIIIACMLCFWGIGKHDVNGWDEARNGVNAYEMLQNQDYVNLYYDHKLDTWNAKPPLLIWFIALSYKIFGFNEFALRLPSAICTLLFFFVFYTLVTRLSDHFKAFLSCLILLSCKAIIGYHVGITGDFDALLLLLLNTSAWFFLLFIESGKRNAIYYVAICTGLAFYTKGPPALIYVPGFVLYALLKGRLGLLIKDRKTWLATGLFLLIVGSWFTLVANYGAKTEHSFYGSKNAIETMVIYDSYARMTSSNFEHEHRIHDYFFLVSAFDVRMNLWNYIFYIGSITGMVISYRHRNNIAFFLRKQLNNLLLYSICLMLPLSIVLTLSMTTHDWYVTPLWGFFAVIITETIVYFGKKRKLAYIITSCLFVFTISRHFIYLNHLPDKMHYSLNKENKIFKPMQLILVTHPPQELLLYIDWIGANHKQIDNVSDISSYKNQGDVLITERANIPAIANEISPIQYFNQYCIGKIK